MQGSSEKRKRNKFLFQIFLLVLVIFYCTTWDIGVAHKVIMLALPLITNKKFIWKCFHGNLYSFWFDVFWLCFLLGSPLVTMVVTFNIVHSTTLNKRPRRSKTRFLINNSFCALVSCSAETFSISRNICSFFLLSLRQKWTRVVLSRSLPPARSLNSVAW